MPRPRPRLLGIASALVLSAACGLASAAPVGTAFTYQGQLTKLGAPVNGTADLRFTLFTQSIGGSAVGTPQTISAVGVTDGLFSTQVDFGVNAYATDQEYWLQIEVRNPAGGGAFSLLGARQRMSAAPYSFFSKLSESSAFSESTRGITVVGQINEVLTDSNLKIPANTGIFTHGGALNTGGRLHIQSGNDGTYDGLFLNPYAVDGGDVWVGTGAGHANLIALDRVGIGTPTPSDRLHVKGGRLRVDQTDGVGGSAVIQLTNGTTSNAIYTAAGSGDLILDTESPADNVLLAPNGGNVGIGDVPATSDTRVTIHHGYTPLGTQRTNLFLSQPQCGWGTGAEFTNYRYIKTDACSNTEGGFKQFNVAPGGVSIGYSNTPAYGSTDAMYINGNVGIGTNVTSQRLTVAGNIDATGYIVANGIFYPSSARFKLNIAPMTDALEKLLKVDGVSFDWNPDYAKDRPGREHDIGFIAEDVAKVFPEVVFYDAEGQVSGIDYSRMSAVAVQAIKQLKAEGDEKDAQIAELKARLEKIESLIAASGERSSTK